MNIRKLLYFLFFIFFVFITNVFLYYQNEEYRDFVKKIKGEEIIVDDVYTWVYTARPEDVEYKEEEEEITEWEMELGIIKEESWTWEIVEEKEEIVEEEKASMTSQDNAILKEFSFLQLKRVFNRRALFDLTEEYPDEYFEYTNDETSIYFFVSRNYDDLVDIFNALSLELPFKLNKTDSFWTRSFFINLDSDFNDDNVRLVVEYKKRVFWLKIKKSAYNQIKEVLLSLAE